MPRLVPAHAGYFRVTLRIPNDRDWCADTRDSFDEWMGELAASKHAAGLGAQPSVRVAAVTQETAELILEWVHQPAEGPWEAVEVVIDTAKVAFPDILTKTNDLYLSVVRESAVGHDVLLDEDRVAELEREGQRRARLGGSPSDFG